jgi:hypothetical protein
VPRAERLILQVPAGSAGEISARLLDRTGKPLTTPVTTATQQDAAGVRWHRVEIVLAPLAQGDYIVETSLASSRTLAAFRVVP